MFTIFYIFYCGYRNLQRQFDVAQKRNVQLNEIVESNKANNGAAGPSNPAR